MLIRTIAPSAAMSATLNPLSRTTGRFNGFGRTASTSALISAGNDPATAL
jgi:hypothetical protein